MPKISIIVPVYNVEKYITKCINSLINQTLKDIEIICINDGSCDNSYNILLDLAKKDNRIRVINQENQGISATRNNGVEISDGEYIAFLDSDDWVDLHYYEKLYNSAVKYNADIAVSEIIEIKDNHKRTLLSFDEENVYEKYEDKLEICGIPQTSYVWNKIYKKDSYLKSGMKFVPGMIYEDYVYTPQILYYTGKLVTVPYANYYYFRHKHSLVKTKTKKSQKDFLHAQETITNFYKEHNVDISKLKIKTKKYKMFGITLFKTITENGNTKHILFNLIKW